MCVIKTLSLSLLKNYIMQYAKNILLLIGIATLATSCVSKKKYDMAIEELDGLRIERARLVTDLSNCETSLDSSKASNSVLTEENVTLTEDLNYCESSNEILIDRMADLSVITSEGSTGSTWDALRFQGGGSYSENGVSGYRRVDLTSLGLRVKYQPLEYISNF